MMKMSIDPVSEWPILRFVCDEEGSQNRAMRFLFSFVGLRGAVSPEISHPKWNTFKRSVASAGLQYDLLRLTIAANYAHGTKVTGERASKRPQSVFGKVSEETTASVLSRSQRGNSTRPWFGSL